MRSRNGIHILLLAFVLCLLLLPAVQKKLKIFHPGPLQGSFKFVSKPAFSADSLLDGRYQYAFTKYAEDSVPFKSWLIRLNNQADFSFWGVLHSKLATIGKNGYLFEETYIRSYLGGDYIGDKQIQAKIERLTLLKDELSKRNIFFLLVFAPSKARFMPENIPDRYLWARSPKNNYQEFTKILSKPETGIPFIDFNNYFLKLKDTSKIPLYPKGGTHWSKFSALAIAGDSILNYLNVKTGRKIADFKLKDVKWSKDLQEPDNDISKGLNLIFPYPGPAMPYPDYQVEKKPDYWNPDLLVIADSYYWIFQSAEIFKTAFHSRDFWYYNEQYMPADKYDSLDKNPAVIKEDLLAHNVIILMATEVNLSHLFSFPEKTLALLDPDNQEVKRYMADKERRIRNYMLKIRKNQDWVSMIKGKARMNNVPFEKQLYDDAKFMVDHE